MKLIENIVVFWFIWITNVWGQDIDIMNRKIFGFEGIYFYIISGGIVLMVIIGIVFIYYCYCKKKKEDIKAHRIGKKYRDFDDMEPI